jgi:RsiW-degrading membrane proteinase PrsW (M82 family)
VILVFRPLAVSLRLIYYTNRYLLFIVYNLIAKQTLAPSRAVSANSSPASLKRASNRVVFQTNKTPLATSTKINSTILTHALSLVLLVLITSPVFLYYQAGRIFPIYYTSVPYKINKNIQIVIIFFSKKTRGLFFIHTRLRIY